MISENGSIRSEAWDDDWWGKVRRAEEGRPICGAKIIISRMPLEVKVCTESPDTRTGRCKRHFTADKLYGEDIFASGLNGIRTCSSECKNKCEYSSKGFDLRAVKPFCFVEYETYTNQIKELLAELLSNKIEVKQYTKIAIQSIAMTIVQILRCDQELSTGTMVLQETQVFKSRDNERTIVTPKENPAIIMKTKLLKSLGELAKTLMLSPKEKSEEKGGKEKHQSAAEFLMDVVSKAGGVEGGHVTGS